MLLIFRDGGGTASVTVTPSTFPIDIRAGNGLVSTDAVFHHRAPHRRAMWADVARRTVLKHADALRLLAD